MIYFLLNTATKRVKIGHSDRSVHKRIITLQIGACAPLELAALAPGTKETERRLHRHFERHCVHGEWFRRTRSLTALMDRVRLAFPESQFTQFSPDLYPSLAPFTGDEFAVWLRVDPPEVLEWIGTGELEAWPMTRSRFGGHPSLWAISPEAATRFMNGRTNWPEKV